MRIDGSIHSVLLDFPPTDAQMRSRMGLIHFFLYTDLIIQNGLLNFFDPCKSVSPVVRFGFLCKAKAFNNLEDQGIPADFQLPRRQPER